MTTAVSIAVFERSYELDMAGRGEGACAISAYGRAYTITSPRSMLVGGVGDTGGLVYGTTRQGGARVKMNRQGWIGAGEARVWLGVVGGCLSGTSL